MMRLIDLRGQTATTSKLRSLVPRASLDISQAVFQAEPLVRSVRERGEPALREQAEKFDGVTGHTLRISEQTLAQAEAELSPELRDAVNKMITRVRLATRAGIPDPKFTEVAPGSFIEQRWEPVQRVGLYVPGGKAVYPSSVVMNVVAAQEAGVSELALASPVQRSSQSVHPTVLAVASLLGVKEVYAIGGAAAVAAFAYGVPEIGLEPVDMVTGPGNIFVAAAKRIVNGVVGIDSEAGTTEILVVADETATAPFIAADLVSQAEHDEAAASLLVTDSVKLVEDVQREAQSRAQSTMNSQRVLQALRGTQSGIVLVDSMDDAINFANIYGAEHLEIHTKKVDEVVKRIHNAGAIFAGEFSPVSLGDYLAGSNHVLPTGGTSRFQAGLGAHTFLRAQQIIRYDREGLRNTQASLNTLAAAEGLPAHGEAVDARFEG